MSYLKHIDESVNKVDKLFIDNFECDIIITKGIETQISDSFALNSYTFTVNDRSHETDLATALYWLITDSYKYCKSETDRISIDLYPMRAVIVVSEGE